MREYKIKRGYEASNSRLEELLKKYFGNFTSENGYYIVRNFGSIEEMKLKLENKALFVETKTKLLDNETSLKTLKAYNGFLEEFTGYTAKERQKMLRKEVES
ncbi:MAG: hypothetical protein PWQ22_1300 [Archaeoglobaceae archaeon]|nr:hypothetical protein [Archaeoglobaceae archaeon]